MFSYIVKSTSIGNSRLYHGKTSVQRGRLVVWLEDCLDFVYTFLSRVLESNTTGVGCLVHTVDETPVGPVEE